MVLMVRHGWRMLASSPAAAICVLLGAALQVGYRLSVPYFFQQIFDEGIVGGDGAVLSWCLLGLTAALLLFAIGILLQERAMSALGSLATNLLRVRLFEKLLAMPPKMHSQHSPASLVNRMGGDLEQVEMALVRGAPLFLVQGTIVVASVLILFAIEWRLALLVLVSLPLAVALAKPFRRRGRKAWEDSQALRTRMLKLTNEASSGHMLLRMLGGTAAALSRFHAVVQQFGLFQARNQFMTALSARSAQVSAGVTQLVVIGVGGWLAHRGYMTGGLLVAFITLLGNVSGGVSYIADSSALLTRGVTALSDIEAILNQPGDLADRADAQAFPPPTQAIAFDRVSFSYDNALTLDDVSFVVPPGQRVCLVGPSGSGKSTVLALLARLLEPGSGAIRFDGAPLTEATEASLRRIMTMVPQSPVLFDGTMHENILIGRPDASEEGVARAVESAALTAMVAALPDGASIQVGEGGGLLSGGQRQRVAIARALVRDAPILLLDEATSALDPASEAMVDQAIVALPPGHTVLAVTHRLATAASFDRVLVFDKGRLVQDGPHARLVGEAGLYAQLWERVRLLPEPDRSSGTAEEGWLRTVPFLKSCPADLLRSLAPMFLSEHLPEAREVFRQGDPGQRFYILVRGTVEVLVEGPDRSSTRVALLRDGDFFGEVALVSGRTRNATIRTLTDCWFLTLHRDPFLRLLSEHEEAGAAVHAAVAARLPMPIQPA